VLTLDYFKKTFEFSKINNVPLYSQLASYIEIQIQAGVLKPGEKMLTENELCEALNISRTTVRQALSQIVDEGLMFRYRGRGTFIAEKKIERNINYLYNFTESIKSNNFKPSSEVLNCKKILANSTISKILQLPETSKNVFFLERLRCANGIPLLKENTYIPYFLVPGIEEIDFSFLSLYDTLKNSYSLKLDHATEKIEAILLNKKLASQLQTNEKNMVGYRIERISKLLNGIPYEFTYSITRADKCEFKIDLFANSNKGRNRIDFSRKLNL